MRIALLVLASVLLLSVLSVYLFIPANLVVGNVVAFHGTATGVGRALHKKKCGAKSYKKKSIQPFSGIGQQ